MCMVMALSERVEREKVILFTESIFQLCHMNFFNLESRINAQNHLNSKLNIKQSKIQLNI